MVRWQLPRGVTTDGGPAVGAIVVWRDVLASALPASVVRITPALQCAQIQARRAGLDRGFGLRWPLRHAGCRP